MSSLENYYALDKNTVVSWLQKTGLANQLLGSNEHLHSQDLADGNVNLVFRVSNAAGRSLIVKQSLPWARKYPDFKLPLDRAVREYGILQSYVRHCPEFVPEVYHFDADMYVCIMQDLQPHVILRTGLQSQQHYPLLAQHLGEFLAKSLFFSSDLALPSAEKKARVPQFINPVLVKAQEDVCFTQPLQQHAHNHCHAELEQMAAALRADQDLYAAVLRMKRVYMTSAEALLHGDLHTGSMLVTPTETRIFDPEFGFYGPMAYDLGCLVAHLYIGHVCQPVFARRAGATPGSGMDMLELIRQIWQVFSQQFAELARSQSVLGEWQSERYIQRYLDELLQDTLAFAGVELIRRTIGLAHAPEWELMAEEPALIPAAQQSLGMARHWLLRTQPWSNMDSALQKGCEA
ncbi:S-methyl-5-thioribose kinase [Perlucidibaca aquatica]|uniref:S-methyl-5-thioribose kinase n=1 Tax=Perlucidibaca aquatica TaxID=1852776 RepID=UPI00083B46FA|nr:S-methyl-5-thioribose kinase [Perlucidibaca aquatica]